MRKNILIAAYSMDVGGIETALITLLKNIHNKYNITLVLEKKEGMFLEEVPSNVEIITYTPNNWKIAFFRKTANLLKQMKFKLKYKNKFDFSACYATYSYSNSFVARTASKNSALWVHNDYMSFYNNDESKYAEFFEKLKADEFKKIIFVSEHDKNVFTNQFKKLSEKTEFCNNLIDYKKIKSKANENVTDFSKGDNVVTFINIGRHDEKQKKLSRIIEATKRLNEEDYVFRVIFVGSGKNTEEYKKQAEGVINIEFLGAKQNPYPYLKNSDCLVMSSDFEGYPVVFIESLILGKSIITTDVSDSRKDIDGKYGLVVPKSVHGVYSGMKNFLEKGYDMKKFDAEKFNEDIIEKLDKIISCK